MESNSPEPAVLADEKPLYDSVLALYAGYVASAQAQPQLGDTDTWRATLKEALQRLPPSAARDDVGDLLDAAICITPHQYCLLRTILDAVAAMPAQERSLEPHRPVPSSVLGLVLSADPTDAFQLRVLEALIFRGPCDPSFVPEVAFAEVLLHHEPLDDGLTRRLLEVIHMARDVSCERDFLSGIFQKELQHRFNAERSSVADDIASAAGQARHQGYLGEARLDALGEALRLLYDTDTLTAPQAQCLREIVQHDGEAGLELTQAFHDVLAPRNDAA